jgi:hypothetical protein
MNNALAAAVADLREINALVVRFYRSIPIEMLGNGAMPAFALALENELGAAQKAAKDAVISAALAKV